MEWDISKQDFWWLFKDVWLDSENIFENKILWHSLLKTHRDEPQLMMNEDERETLESMPDKLTVYRGGMDDKGFSWTLNKDTAKWFANKWIMNGNLETNQMLPKGIIQMSLKERLIRLMFLPILMIGMRKKSYTFHNKLGEGHFNEWLSPFFLV